MSIAPPKPTPLTPGYRLDRYELLCPIAEGGMASVWVARLRGKHGFEKLVAIKTILPKYASDTRFQQMFLDEARIASGIEHTNVAQILDLGEHDDILYLVMEWVDGNSLSKLMRAADKQNATIPTGVVCRILADTCGGLHAAHELKDAEGRSLGVVHRDVSPQNILVSTKGTAKLIDFGIAKARDRVAEDTSVGLLKGKVQYMAPEQALGQHIDGRADIWAIGAIMYHLFAKRPAYEGENQLVTLHLLTSGKPPPPLPSNVPKPVQNVIRKAMAFAPEHRFASAAEMQRALERAMIEAHIATSTADVAAFADRHMAERAKMRKKSVDLALKAASERERVEQVLRQASETTPAGVREHAPLHTNVLSTPGLESTPQSGSSFDAPSAPKTPDWQAPNRGAGSDFAGGGSAPSCVRTTGAPPRLGYEANGGAPVVVPPSANSQALSAHYGSSPEFPELASVSSQVSSTLGSAGVMTPPSELPNAAPTANGFRKRLPVVVAAALGVAATLALVATFSLSGNRPTQSTSSPPSSEMPLPSAARESTATPVAQSPAATTPTPSTSAKEAAPPPTTTPVSTPSAKPASVKPGGPAPTSATPTTKASAKPKPPAKTTPVDDGF